MCAKINKIREAILRQTKYQNENIPSASIMMKKVDLGLNKIKVETSKSRAEIHLDNRITKLKNELLA